MVFRQSLAPTMHYLRSALIPFFKRWQMAATTLILITRRSAHVCVNPLGTNDAMESVQRLGGDGKTSLNLFGPPSASDRGWEGSHDRR